jgi:hypothetical protein
VNPNKQFTNTKAKIMSTIDNVSYTTKAAFSEQNQTNRETVMNDLHSAN